MDIFDSDLVWRIQLLVVKDLTIIDCVSREFLTFNAYSLNLSYQI